MMGIVFEVVARPNSVFVEVTSHGFISWILIGLIAGWLTGHLTRGRGFGCLLDVILGIIGAYIGGWIFSKIGIEVWGFVGSLAAATVGAVLLVSVARLISGSRAD